MTHKHMLAASFAVAIGCFGAEAQQITAISTIGTVTITPPGPQTAQPGVVLPGGPPVINVQSYSATEEDYVAAMYYNVSVAAALYKGSNTNSLATGQGLSNPTVAGNLTTPVTGEGIYTEVSSHYLNFFYIASLGDYYDPYGYSSLTNGEETDDSNDYWLSVYVYGTYVATASVLLGQTWESMNYTQREYANSAVALSALYQAFIPPAYVTGPAFSGCPGSVFLGDNRGFNNSLGSYRVFEQVTIGVNTSSDPSAVNTGVTRRFAPDAIVKGQIPPSSYDLKLHDCHLLDAIGKASTSSMQAYVTSAKPGSTSAYFTGAVADPVTPGLFTPTLDWAIRPTLTLSGSVVNVSGNYELDCYPAHEFSISGVDEFTYLPPPTINIYGIAACLSGLAPVNGTLSTPINLSPIPR